MSMRVLLMSGMASGAAYVSASRILTETANVFTPLFISIAFGAGLLSIIMVIIDVKKG